MDVSKFTPEFKDRILKSLCETLSTYTYYSIRWDQWCNDKTLMLTCLNQFKERGFVSELNFSNTGNCGLVLTSRAVDFVVAGGFTAEYAIFEVQMSKAILELEKLQSNPALKDHVQQIAGITGILSDLVTTFGALSKIT